VLTFAQADQKEPTIAIRCPVSDAPNRSLVAVRHARRVLPGVFEMVDNLVHANSVLHLREGERAGAAHLFRVAFHHFEIGADGLRKVGLVDHEQIALRNAGASFARNFVATGHVDYVDGYVHQFGAERGGQVIPSAFDEDQFEAGMAAFEVGNRHFPLALDGDRLLVSDDQAGVIYRISYQPKP